MSDLPHDELLSAYLDGELNDAERAEVDRLLAADPAARRRLDEFRALSVALHALPAEKLGEDLSPQVVREAERRIAAETGLTKSAAASALPVPLSKEVFKRFLSRRSLGWLAVTIAVAVAITINERYEREQKLARRAENSVAVAHKAAAPMAAPRRLSEESDEVPRMSAVPAKPAELGLAKARSVGKDFAIQESEVAAPPIVGRITGMADVTWQDQTSGMPDANLRVGRRLAPASGLVEVTYNAGLKVILQGPCVYQVDSAHGGFLSVGKLTARSEKKGERRGARDAASQSAASDSKSLNPQIPKSLSSNPQSPIPNPSFAIRTPTAVLTDLSGAEFGVEVEKSGTTLSHAFSGRVQLRDSNSRGPTARGEVAESSDALNANQFIELTADQSASVKVGGNGEISMAREATSEPTRFVRAMPPPAPKRDAQKQK